MTDNIDTVDRKSSFANRATMESVNKRIPKEYDIRESSVMSRQHG